MNPRGIILAVLIWVEGKGVSPSEIAGQHHCISFLFEVFSGIVSHLALLLGLSQISFIVIEKVKTMLDKAFGRATFPELLSSIPILVLAHVQAADRSNLSVVVKRLQSHEGSSVSLRNGVKLALFDIAVDLEDLVLAFFLVQGRTAAQFLIFQTINLVSHRIVGHGVVFGLSSEIERRDIFAC